MADLLTSSPVMADGDMPSMPDPIFNRLLKDRIIWMGEEVKDEMANRICAQMLMLAAEDPKKGYLAVHQFPGRLHHRRHGHLRHHAAYRA